MPIPKTVNKNTAIKEKVVMEVMGSSLEKSVFYSFVCFLLDGISSKGLHILIYLYFVIFEYIFPILLPLIIS